MLTVLPRQRGERALLARDARSASAGARRAASGLVIAQVALAVVLLAGAGLIIELSAVLLSVDPGFRFNRGDDDDLCTPACRSATSR